MSEAAAPASPSGPGVTPDFLPPPMRKHVDPAAPVPLRMMAAKALVPLSPSDMLGALYLLTFDPDANIRETAAKTAEGLPDRLLATSLRDEGVKPPVLGFFLDLFAARDTYAEMLVLNASTPDEAVARAALSCGPRTVEAVAQNQLRFLRHDDIVRQLCLNPSATPSQLDGMCDFAVRSGLILQDVPQMLAARIRVFGPEVAAKPPDLGPTAEQVLKDFQELKDEQENAAPMEEGKRMNLTQRVMKMSISEKIKLATKGNKEARTILLRDSNKLVAVAAIRSPRITDGEVLTVANNRGAMDDVLRVVYSNREWLKNYPVKLALVKNPKVPLAISMKFLTTLRESEIKDLSRSKNVPNGVQVQAKKMLEKKDQPKKEK